MSRAEREIIKVKCRSGYTFAQRPESFIYRHEDYKVEEVKLQWQEPGEIHFGIITRDRKSFKLCYNDSKDESALEKALFKGGRGI